MEDRVRITTTLKPSIVKLLDTRIDGINIRNRSHAIEYFLKKSLFRPVNQAVIFAGDSDKPLMEFGKKTVINRMLEQLKTAGVGKIIICTSDDALRLKKYLKQSKFKNFEIIFVQNSTSGTAMALLECKPYLDPENFLVIYGDVLAELDFYDLMDYHQSHQNLATMVITSIPNPLPWGVVNLKRDKITSFTEKPSDKAKLTNLINTGIFVFQPEIFAYVSEKYRSLEKEVFPAIARKNKLNGYFLDGVWFDIGEKNLLELAKKYPWAG